MEENASHDDVTDIRFGCWCAKFSAFSAGRKKNDKVFDNEICCWEVEANIFEINNGSVQLGFFNKQHGLQMFVEEPSFVLIFASYLE